MKSCCVIGGGGFIGYHVVKKLVSRKKRTIVVDKYPVPSENIERDVEYVVGDYGNKGFISDVLKLVDEVVVLAYSSVPKTSFEDPILDIMENLPPIVKFFQVASELDVEKVVVISSGGTVYGDAHIQPIREDHPTNPISPYGVTKLAIEKYAFMFGKIKGLPVICVRPGNAYGEGQRPFTGQGFIATSIASIIMQKEITVFGEQGVIRDYIYVQDVANGIVALLEHGKPSSCYNIGCGVGRSIKDVLGVLLPFAVSAGLKPKIKILPQRAYDVATNILDCSKIFEDTGWKAVVPFEEGIKKTWEWLSAYSTVRERHLRR
jgi:UDP-glucose 4-epimerase